MQAWVHEGLRILRANYQTSNHTDPCWAMANFQMTLTCLHHNLVLIPWARYLFFLTWYLWICNVQSQVHCKTSSLSVSHSQSLYAFDISVPCLYNGKNTSSQRSCEEELKFSRVLQWCAKVAIVICHRKVKMGNVWSPAFGARCA